jgi:hypothetical protein
LLVSDSDQRPGDETFSEAVYVPNQTAWWVFENPMYL